MGHDGREAGREVERQGGMLDWEGRSEGPGKSQMTEKDKVLPHLQYEQQISQSGENSGHTNVEGSGPV